MSHFSDVDAAPSVDALAAYLERTDHSMSALKAYVAATLAHDVPGGLILDVGCGLGHDLAGVAAAGLQPIGVDLSAALLARAACPGVAQADASCLPFRDDAFDGLRIERTLQHVADVARCLDEIARVLRPGGTVAVLDADFAQFRVESEVMPHGTWPAALLTSRHPNIGGVVGGVVARRATHEIGRGHLPRSLGQGAGGGHEGAGRD